MSQTVDNRVVQMKFDNGQFEQGAQKTLSTLNKLKEATSFKGSMEGLTELQNAGKKFDFSGVSSAVESVSLKFSALEIAGIEALRNITNFALGKFRTVWNNTIGQIMTGGKSRALNLEQARFSMSGLFSGMYNDSKVVSEKVEEVMGDRGPVQEAVAGTAYGLDAAALAASNLLATGLDIKDLEKPLKTISGLAAQTGKSYEMMADVINDTYAKSYASGMEISRLQEQGINAVAELQKYYKELKGVDYSADQINDMIRKKQVSAKDFTEALYHYYENAARANDTYTGSLSNLKAALSRVGQKFYDPHIKNMTKIFNAFRIAVNALNANALGPLFNILNGLDSMFTKVAVSIADFISNYFGFNNKIHELGRSSEVIPEMRSALLTLIDEFKNVFDVISEAASSFISPFKAAILYIKGSKDVLEEFKTDASFAKIVKEFARAITSFKSFFNGFINVALKGLYLFDELWTSIFKVLVTKLLPLFLRIGGIIAKVLTPILNFLSNIAEIISEYNIIPSIIGRIADILVGVIKPIIDWFDNKLKGIEKSGFVAFLNKMRDGFVNFASSLEDLLYDEKDFTWIGNGIIGFFKDANKILSPLTSKIKEFVSVLGNVKDNLKEKLLKIAFGIGQFVTKERAVSVIEKIAAAFKWLFSVLSPIASKLVEWLTSIGKSLATAFSNNFNIENILNFGAIAVAIQMWQRADWDAMLTKLFQPLNSIVDTVNQFKDILNTQVTTDLKSFALAMLMLAGSLLILSLIDPAKLVTSGYAMLAIIEAVKGIAEYFSGFSKKQVASFASMSVALSIFSGALLGLAIIIKFMSTIPLFGLVKGIGSLYLILQILEKSLKSLSTSLMFYKTYNARQLLSIAVMMVALALAVGILSKAVKRMGSLSWESLIKGLGSLVIVLLSLSRFSEGRYRSNMAKVGIGLIGVAIAINIIAKAVEKMGSLTGETWVKGLAGVGLMLLGIAMFLDLINGTKNPVKNALMVIVIAESLVVMAKALQKVGSMPLENALIALTALGSLLLIIAATLKIMPAGTKVVAGAAGIVAISLALLVFATAIAMVSLIPVEKVAQSMLVLVGVLAIFIGIAFILSAAFTTLVFGIPMLVALSAAMALFGAGVLALATGIAILTPILVLFAGAFIKSLEIVLSGIIKMGGSIIQAVGVLVSSFIIALKDSIPLFIDLITELASSLLTFFNENIPLFIELVSTLIDTIIEIVTVNLPKIINFVINCIVTLLEALATRAPELINAGFNLIISLINGIAMAVEERSEELAVAAGNLVSSLITGLINGLWTFAETVWNNIDQFATEFVEEHFKVDLGENSLFDVGLNLIKGLWEGFKSWMGTLWDNIKEWGQNLIKNTREEVFEIKSPSRVFEEIGAYCMEGMAIGLSQTDGTFKAIDEAGDSILSAFRSTMSNIEDVINSDMNMQPTVTPVLDLSQIQNGVSTMNGMFGLTNGMTASISGKLAAMRSHQADNDLKAIAETIKKANDVPTVNMTVYGAQGQDVRELAEIVSNRIQHQLSRREMALG